MVPFYSIDPPISFGSSFRRAREEMERLRQEQAKALAERKRKEQDGRAPVGERRGAPVGERETGRKEGG